MNYTSMDETNLPVDEMLSRETKDEICGSLARVSRSFIRSTHLVLTLISGLVFYFLWNALGLSYVQQVHQVDTSDIMSKLTDVSPRGARMLEELDQSCIAMARRPYNPAECQAAPFLLVTFHGEKLRNGRIGHDSHIHTVCKFSRDGCGLGSAIMPANDGTLQQTLRGITIDRSTNELYVLEAYRKSSYIRKFSSCNESVQHRREPLSFLSRGGEWDPGLIHPYALALDHSGEAKNIFVSTQGTYAILEYDVGGIRTNFDSQTMITACNDGGADYPCHKVSLPASDLWTSIIDNQYSSELINAERRKYIGSLWFPNQFAALKTDVRGVAVDSRGAVYVAAKKGGLIKYAKDGTWVGSLTHIHPISLHYDHTRDVLWTGCARSNTLLEIFAETLTVKREINVQGRVSHPTGIARHGSFLYLISQGNFQIVKMDISDPEYPIYVILDNLPDKGEFVAISNC